MCVWRAQTGYSLKFAPLSPSVARQLTLPDASNLLERENNIDYLTTVATYQPRNEH